MSNSFRPHGLYRPWNSPDQNTGVGNLSLLQGIFPTQGSNPGLLHYRQILYQLSHKGSPRIQEWVAYPFSSGSSQSRNWTGVSCTAGRFFANWAMREANLLYKYRLMHTEAQSFLWFPYNHFTLTYGVIPLALLNLWWNIIQSISHLLLCFKPSQVGHQLEKPIFITPC